MRKPRPQVILTNVKRTISWNSLSVLTGVRNPYSSDPDLLEKCHILDFIYLSRPAWKGRYLRPSLLFLTCVRRAISSTSILVLTDVRKLLTWLRSVISSILYTYWSWPTWKGRYLQPSLLFLTCVQRAISSTSFIGPNLLQKGDILDLIYRSWPAWEVRYPRHHLSVLTCFRRAISSTSFTIPNLFDKCDILDLIYWS